MFSAAKTAGPSGYNISRSVRLRSSASAYLNRTLTTPTNNKIWTWSSWVKRGTLGAAQVLLSSDVGTSNSTWLEFGFDAADTFTVTAYTTDSNTTSAVFRDPSAWYHIVVAFDSTQATAANRCKIYVNNVQQSLTGSGFTLNAGYGINSAQAHSIGQRNWASGVGRYFDGYLTEINFIDGQALTPSSFGSTNATTGVWQPAKYTGTYGTNGFYLNFSDNSAATAAAIGKDYSGNGNNWTPNNISVTAGATYDSMLDVPTPYADGGNGRGDYCVMNPVGIEYGGSFAGTCSNGNLSFATSGNASHGFGTISLPSTSSAGYYFEVVCTSMDTARTYIGLIDPWASPSTSSNGASYSWPYKAVLYNAGTYFNFASGTGGTGGTSYTSYAANDVVMIAYKNGVIWFGKNGTWMNSGNPAAGTGYIDNTLDTTKTWMPYVGYNSNFDVNFGQRPFTYTPPSGFKALNTYNLPASTITNGGKYMAATTYTGTGASQSVTNAGSFKPDLVWIKSRSTVGDTEAYDSVRGATKYLLTDSTVAEGTIAQSLTAFNSNGFALGTGSGGNDNTNGTTYIGWQWQAGQGSTSSNTSGSITSTVSVNATAGFSIVTYTGNATSGATVGHGLGVKPAMIIGKNRSGAAQNWQVWHQSMGDNVMQLNLTNAQVASTSNSVFLVSGINSTVFQLGTNPSINGSATTQLAYCWSEIAGFSKFGSYTGNGSTNGTFVYLGFRPRYIMWKRSDSTGDWIIQDTSRATYNASDTTLYANLSAAESVGGGYPIDVLSNGFKMRTAATYANASGGTYIYAAFAENPFANALAR